MLLYFHHQTRMRMWLLMLVVKRWLHFFNGNFTLCKNVGAAKSFVAPERLPPTFSAMKYHALRSYYQVMQWMNEGTIGDRTNWE